MVARTCLRTPRSKIVEMSKKVRHKRHDFTLAISQGLIPPETPPALRRRIRRRRFPGVMGIDPIENVSMFLDFFIIATIAVLFTIAIAIYYNLNFISTIL
jgi:hypothetical protein